MAKVRIVVADDHEIVRCGVVALLESQPDYAVVGEAANGREALHQTERLRPDIVILDVSMPELNGIEATRQILKAVPQTEVLILTMHESEKLVRRILDAGARGYVSKSDVARSLPDGIEALRRHKAFLSSSAATAVMDVYLRGPDDEPTKTGTGLTAREREVLQLLAEGKGNKEVASTLDISLYTAATHRRNIMQKLNCHTVAQLTRYAIHNELISA